MYAHLYYDTILIALSVGCLLFHVVILAIIGIKSAYFAILDSNFDIHKISTDGKEIILDVYGSRLNFSTNRKLRITIRAVVLISLYIVSIVFVDACILSRNILTLSSTCPSTSKANCFHYPTAYSANANPFYCPPNEPVSVTNITAEGIVCFTWEIKLISTVGILNQLGICSSILSLLGATFKCLYYITRRKYWGIPLTITIGVAIMIVPMILWMVFGITMSTILSILTCAAIFLVFNVLFLARIVHNSNNQIRGLESNKVDQKHLKQ